MGWQTLRQMGEAAVGRQSNHIHLACFLFPLFMCFAGTYQQAGTKEPGIITLHTNNSANTHALVQSLGSTRPPQCSRQLKYTSDFPPASHMIGILRACITLLAGGKKKSFVSEVILASILISLLANQALTWNILNDLFKTLKFPFSSVIFCSDRNHATMRSGKVGGYFIRSCACAT